MRKRSPVRALFLLAKVTGSSLREVADGVWYLRGWMGTRDSGVANLLHLVVIFRDSHSHTKVKRLRSVRIDR